jgi:hypothetical protein
MKIFYLILELLYDKNNHSFIIGFILQEEHVFKLAYIIWTYPYIVHVRKRYCNNCIHPVCLKFKLSSSLTEYPEYENVHNKFLIFWGLLRNAF